MSRRLRRCRGRAHRRTARSRWPRDCPWSGHHRPHRVRSNPSTLWKMTESRRGSRASMTPNRRDTPRTQLPRGTNHTWTPQCRRGRARSPSSGLREARPRSCPVRRDWRIRRRCRGNAARSTPRRPPSRDGRRRRSWLPALW